MVWESRGGAAQYLVVYQRRDGRVVRTYHGRGPIAELVDHEMIAGRAERADRLAADRAVQRRLDTLDRQIVALDRAVCQAMRSELIRRGFHTHKRQWRKRRAFKGRTRMGLPSKKRGPTIADLADQIRRFQAALLAEIAADFPNTAPHLPVFMAARRAELAGNSVEPIEHILIASVLLNELSLQHASLMLAAADEASSVQHRYLFLREGRRENQLLRSIARWQRWRRLVGHSR